MTNRELAEESFAAFQRGDLDAAFAAAKPDFEFDNRTDAPDAEGVWRGFDGWLEMMGRITEPFSEYALEVLETHQHSDDEVTLTLIERARGKSSGIEIERHVYLTYTFEDGRLARLVTTLEPPAR